MSRETRTRAAILVFSVALVFLEAFSVSITSSQARPKASPYKLPYPAGMAYLVTQGNDTGKAGGTHYGIAEFAFDFGMGGGDPVVVSREGRVLYVKDDSNEGGCHPFYGNKANYVVIDHGDGSSALYLHLKYKSVVVQEEEWVEQGQVIASADASGYVCGRTGNHLHFQIQKTPKSRQHWYTQSMTISFSDEDVLAKEPDGIPKTGRKYESDNKVATRLISPWPMYRHDAQRTACTTYKGPEVPELKWTFRAGGRLSAPVIAADGTMYIDSEDGNLYALDPWGNKKWACPLSGEVISPPAVASDGTILVARGSNLDSIRPDGTLGWTYSSDHTIFDLAIGPDGTIYAGSERLHAVSPDGRPKWVSRDETCTGFGALAIAEDGTIYGMTWVDVCAFGSDGALKWKANTAPGARGNNTSITLGRYGGCVYVNGEAALGAHMAVPIASLRCLGPEGYRLDDFPGYIASPPAIGQDGTVYVGWHEVGEPFETEDGRITAQLGPLHLHAAAFPGPLGLTTWTCPLGSAMCGYPVIGGDGTVYVILCNGDLFAFDSSGNLMWTCNIGESLEVGHWRAWGLAIGAGTLYVSSGSKLYAIGESG